MSQAAWANRVVNNIIQKSHHKTFDKALEEWEFRGRVIDNKKSICTCELCSHENIRYHYILENKVTLQRLKVGSSCIVKYPQIKVDGTKTNSPKERLSVLETALRDAKVNLSLEPLRKLWRKDVDFRDFIENQAKRIKEKKGLSPKVYVIMASKFKKNEIEFDPDHYSISLRKSAFIEQLVTFKSWQLNILKPALSNVQIERHKDIFTK